MWLKSQSRIQRTRQVKPVAVSGALDEQTFWQIVRTEKERADRSGMPVTVAVFTIRDDRRGQGLSGWNAAALCSRLRSTARLTDHVGMAGPNELGVILWGTRELGAYRFVNRLGEQAEQLVEDCRLFVYPTVEAEREQEDSKDDKSRNEKSRGDAHRVLQRIAEVEQKIAQALDVETPVERQDDTDVTGDSFSFGFSEHDTHRRDWEPSPTGMFSTGQSSATATLDAPPETRAHCDVAELDLALNSISGARIVRSLKPIKDTVAVEQTTDDDADAECSGVRTLVEPLENLFIVPHPRWKRAVDIAGALAGLIFLSPIFLAVAAVIRATSPGPILFRQLREGHGGRLFTICKFRTMRVGADAEKATLRAQSEQDGPAFKMTHDPRITPVGSFLRKTCLDELPQLWNVLLGDMTLVGPRPLDYRESSQIARWGRRRLYVMPGLTCIWQVHGKSKVSFNEWMRMDIRYSQRLSFMEDLRLVWATLKQVVLRKASH
ncbi:MAG: sugar transferase [Planctomycetaceae bacterium]